MFPLAGQMSEYAFHLPQSPTIRARSRIVGHGILAAIGAAAIAWLGPPGVDVAAHVYQRVLFLEHGFELWNNYWYGGRYTFVGYSLIYYPLAALVGIKLLAVATAALAASTFAAIARREWPSAGPWPARAFTFVAAASVFTGAFPYALGFAFALLAIQALRPLRRVQFAFATVCVFAASPLAFVLLVVVLAAIGSTRIRSVPLLPAATVGAVGAVGLLGWRLFPEVGVFPFPFSELLAVLVFCAIGLGFTFRVPAANVLARFFLIYALVAIVAFAIPSTLGENITRLRFVALPVAVLCVALRRWRPLLPTIAVLGLAAAWNITPLAFGVAKTSDDPSATAAYWAPAVAYLKQHLQPSYRVEVVDTVGHWDAVYLPEHSIPIARGWFRQEDFPENSVLYGRVTTRRYVRWLHTMSAAYVVRSDAPTDYSSKQEAALLESGRSSLRLVFHSAHFRIYAVPHPRSIVTGPGAPRVVHLSAASMTLQLARPGTYRLAVRYSPYWHLRDGCVLRADDGMTRLVVTRPGTVRLRFAVSAERALSVGIGRAASC